MGLSFSLPDSFVDNYRQLPEPFGFGILGALSFYRTYAREVDDGVLESWVDSCKRVIDGMYSIQKDHCSENGVYWDESKARSSAMEAFDRLFNLKWSPPGRGLYNMGANSVHERGLVEALQNCGFVSTENINNDGGHIFSWIMSMLMLGVGVGSDLKGATKKMVVVEPSPDSVRTYVIPDSREGWSNALALLFNSYFPVNFGSSPTIHFDYSLIRKKGEPIKGFGGVASGPEPLKWMLDKVRYVLSEKANSGNPILDQRTIADIINMIGVVVVAGNVRRSSQILLGDRFSTDFLNLKNYSVNPERAEFGWASNNSVYGQIGMDYSPYVERILDNGEPGFAWFENVNSYGRMNGVKDYRDRATGLNPCGEQNLEGFSPAGVGGELCTLVEVYPYRHRNQYDFLRSLKFAFLYGKTTTLLSDRIKHAGTREIMMRNRRIGVSVTGVAQFLAQSGTEELRKWLDSGYDYIQHYDMRYSSWFNVPRSVRTTTVKPSGTVSLLSGSTPGVHFPHAQYYIRRIRLSDSSHLVDKLGAAGVHIEPDVFSPNTYVAEIPIFAGDNLRSAKDVSMYQQLELAAFMQKHWSDNGVSVTVSVNPKKYSASDVQGALEMYQYRLKSVSMLPEVDGGAFQQMPYEEIDKDTFAAMNSKINPGVASTFRYTKLSSSDKMFERFCDGEACSIA